LRAGQAVAELQAAQVRVWCLLVCSSGLCWGVGSSWQCITMFSCPRCSPRCMGVHGRDSMSCCYPVRPPLLLSRHSPLNS
jgi:hypothetical protein